MDDVPQRVEYHKFHSIRPEVELELRRDDIIRFWREEARLQKLAWAENPPTVRKKNHFYLRFEKSQVLTQITTILCNFFMTF